MLAKYSLGSVYLYELQHPPGSEVVEERCSSRELVTLILSPSRKIPRPAEKQRVSWVVSQPCPCYGGVYTLMQVASSASSSGQFEPSQQYRPQQSVVWGGHHGFSRLLEGKLEFEQSLVSIAHLIKRRREWRECNLVSSHFSFSVVREILSHITLVCTVQFTHSLFRTHLKWH